MKSEDQDHKLPRSLTRPLGLGVFFLFIFAAGAGFWATQAKLATTVHTSGNLKSISPSFEVHSVVSGKIERVLVSLHDTVEQNQSLLEFDVSTQREKILEINQQIEALTTENDLIGQFLSGRFDEFDGTNNWIKDQILTQFHGSRLKSKATQSSKESMQERAKNLAAQVEADVLRKASMQARLEKQSTLVATGNFRSVDAERLREAILAAESDVHRKRGDLERLREDIRQANLSLMDVDNQFRAKLIQTLATNKKRLPELRKQLLDLKQVVDNATVYAPIDGTVSDLQFNTPSMFAGTGAHLLTLTKPAQTFQIEFEIPPQAIDQVYMGMSGQVMLSSLPQRNLPRVNATITAISPVAKRDPEGNIIGYPGRATIQESDLEAVFQVLDHNFRLSIDMPVSIAFEGRQTTFATYLIAPFLAFMNKSLQD